MLFIDPDVASYPMENYKIIYIYKMGNKQRSIYWNPIKLGGSKMNKRRERKREIPSISKPFLPFCTCPTSRWVREQRGVFVPNFCFLPFPPPFFLQPLLFTLDYFRFLSSSSSPLYSPRQCLPARIQFSTDSNRSALSVAQERFYNRKFSLLRIEYKVKKKNNEFSLLLNLIERSYFF